MSQIDRFGGQIVIQGAQPQQPAPTAVDRFGGQIVAPSPMPRRRDFSSVSGPDLSMPDPFSTESLSAGFDAPPQPAVSHEEGEAFNAQPVPMPQVGLGKYIQPEPITVSHGQAEGPLHNAALGMFHGIADLDPETLLGRLAANPKAIEEYKRKQDVGQRGTVAPGKGIVNELSYGAGASAPTMALGAGGAAGVAGKLAKGAMFAVPGAVQTGADTTTQAMDETGDPEKAVKEGAVRAGTNFAIFSLMGPLSEMFGGPEAANIVRQGAATAIKGIAKSGVELGTATVADHITGEVAQEMIRRDKSLTPELAMELLTSPERWKERAKAFGSAALTGGALHAVNAGGRSLTERGAAAPEKGFTREVGPKGEVIEKGPQGERRVVSPDEIAPTAEEQARTAELDKAVNEPKTKKDTLTKDQVKAMAGEGVDQEALDQLLKDEPHVKVDVTPDDFADIPRQNIKSEKIREYADMPAESAPPILAAANADNTLRIADGRHRLLAAALRARDAGLDPTKAKVSAVVPESWAKSKGLIQTPRGRMANEDVRTQAAEYVKQAGLPELAKPSYERVDVSRAKKIADAYDLAKHSPDEPKVKAAYDAFKKETLDQWDFLTKKGVKFEAWSKEGQPYKNSAEMQADVAKNKHLYFFQGGELPANHPLAEKAVGDLTYNDVFRAVHDYFGHAKEGNQFGARGEENAWLAHSVMYGPEARKAMTTETRGQNSWVNFGPHGEANRANPAKTTYAEQKATLLSDEYAGLPSSENAPKTQGGPSEPPTVKAAMGAAAAGQFQGSKLRQAVASLIGGTKTAVADISRDVVASVSRSAMPKLTSIAKAAADKGVRFAAAHVAAEPMARAAVAEVLPKEYKNKDFRIKLGATLVEGRLRALRQKFLAAGDTARAAQVGILIGSVGSPFKTEAEYLSTRAEPEVQQAIARHKAVVQQTAEDIHQQLGGKLDVLDEDGAFINLKALDPTDPQDKRKMPTSTRRGNLRNPRVQKSAFAIPASGDAEAYQLDYQRIVENTVGRNAERFAKKNFIDQLVADGVGKVMTPGQAANFNTQTFERWPDFNGRRAARIEGVVDYAYVTGEGEDRHAVQVKKDLYVDPRIESEVRSAFNVDSPIFHTTGLKVVPAILTHTQIMGPVDFVYHSARIFAQIANSPGGKSFLGDLARKVPGVNVVDAIARIGSNIGKVIQDSPDIRARIGHLAEIGAMRREHKGLLSVIDKAGRLALDSMYDNLVSRKLVNDTEQGRRDFSNQVGQYNSRLQTRIVRELKESGLSPFITAGLSGNLEGIKAMAGNPVAEGNSPQAKAQLWGTQVAGHVMSMLVIPALANYLMTGKVAGRPGIPIGAIDTGKDDENKKHIYIDPMKWVGVRRGMRVTGLNAFLERKRTGGTTHEALTDAWRSALMGWEHPFAGPAVDFATIGATGFDTAGFREAPVVQPGKSQVAENIKAAARQANPTVEAFLTGRREGGTKEGLTKTVSSLSSAIGIGSSKPISEGAKHGSELNTFRDDLKRRAKKVPHAERMAFIRGEMKGMVAQDKARIYKDIQEHPYSWMGR